MIDKILRKVGSILINASEKLRSAGHLDNVETDKMVERVKPWFADRGDKTHRLNYNLNKHSVVVDLGGFEGQWTSDIFSKYCCEIHVFEPVINYYNDIAERFLGNEKIKVYPFGIGSKAGIFEIAIQSDGSSLHRLDGEAREQIKIKKAATMLEGLNVDQIDLMKINIEGAEYDLLEHLIESKWTEKIKNLQIQFHDFVPNAEQRMRNIQQKLSGTHGITYQYEFVWENWERLQ